MSIGAGATEIVSKVEAYYNRQTERLLDELALMELFERV